ncbi:MAG: hypothetical protein FRX49_06939 [Trebouxia sp. A1-2]|nr:MAG: hypothetical protein FRX49_06939 [Trebouxia sp. A1-2]
MLAPEAACWGGSVSATKSQDTRLGGAMTTAAAAAVVSAGASAASWGRWQQPSNGLTPVGLLEEKDAGLLAHVEQRGHHKTAAVQNPCVDDDGKASPLEDRQSLQVVAKRSIGHAWLDKGAAAPEAGAVALGCSPRKKAMSASDDSANVTHTRAYSEGGIRKG